MAKKAGALQPNSKSAAPADLFICNSGPLSFLNLPGPSNLDPQTARTRTFKGHRRLVSSMCLPGFHQPPFAGLLQGRAAKRQNRSKGPTGLLDIDPPVESLE